MKATGCAGQKKTRGTAARVRPGHEAQVALSQQALELHDGDGAPEQTSHGTQRELIGSKLGNLTKKYALLCQTPIRCQWRKKSHIEDRGGPYASSNAQAPPTFHSALCSSRQVPGVCTYLRKWLITLVLPNTIPWFSPPPSLMTIS